MGSIYHCINSECTTGWIILKLLHQNSSRLVTSKNGNGKRCHHVWCRQPQKNKWPALIILGLVCTQALMSLLLAEVKRKLIEK
jgi:hypothetical protein